MAAGCPYRCTGMMPTVRPVTACSTAVASRQKSTGEMSANTGVAPARATALAVAREGERGDDDLVTGPDTAGQQSHVQTRGARADGDTGSAEREVCRELLLEPGDLRPLGQRAAAQHPVDGGGLLVTDEWAGSRDESGHGPLLRPQWCGEAARADPRHRAFPCLQRSQHPVAPDAFDQSDPQVNTGARVPVLPAGRGYVPRWAATRRPLPPEVHVVTP